MKPLQRVKTLVPGLDELLGGGLLEGGVYFVQGNPGTGKTTLANQICFAHIRQGGRALYLTLLTESHSRMMQHMLGQSFFDLSFVPSRIAYLSGYRELENGGLKAIVALVRAELVRQQASLLVLDGLVLPSSVAADDDRRLKEFVHELQSLATMTACNVLLLTSGRGRSIAAEQTMVDGIFELEDLQVGMRAERLFRVSKFRGAIALRGRHSFCITDDGIRIFPRLESLGDEPPPAPRGVAPIGLPALDALFGAGGPQAATSTLLHGASGAGKTLLALQFLAGSSAAEPGLMFGFNETPAALIELARGAGIAFGAAVQRGDVELQWIAAGDHALDQLGHRVLDEVDRRGVRRLAIDALAGFADKSMFDERGYRFLAALLTELRRRAVSSVLVCDDDALAALGVPHIACGLGALVEQAIELSADAGGRVLHVRKARGQFFDATPQRLHIGNDGLALRGPAQ